MALWPRVSGNALNGVGEPTKRRPTPVYWHAPDATPHGPLQKWFYARTTATGPEIAEARRQRQEAIDTPLNGIAPTRHEQTPEAWRDEVKSLARTSGADAVGITRMKAEWVFECLEVPTQPWLIVLAVAHDYEAMSTAPSTASLVEVTRQYARGTRVAKAVANALRARGFDAVPFGGPMAGSFTLIPAAIEAGLGELGKHGSLIHRTLGSNFRLASVLTDVPLLADVADAFGADAFCATCRLCMDACPPQAIGPTKVLVRGEVRWSVDFDKCLPYFNENLGCALCLPVCPFSRPGIGPALAEKLSRRSR
jgi:epoxyqueuosine reductase